MTLTAVCIRSLYGASEKTNTEDSVQISSAGCPNPAVRELNTALQDTTNKHWQLEK